MPTRSLKLMTLEKVRKNQKEATQDGTAPESPLAKKAKTTDTVSTENNMERWMLETPSEVQIRLRHCLLPAFNVGQHPVQSLDELQSDLTCEISLPRPIHLARQHCEGIDICHRRTKAREIYFRRLNYCRAQYQTAHRKNRKLRNLENRDIYPISLYNFAERLECDPDPFFHGSYDYYYTGGNLCMLPETHVVHVDGKNLVNLNIGHLTEEEDLDISLETLWSYPFEKGDEIFEVKPIQNLREDLPNCFAVRQRNSINFCSLQRSGVCKAIIEFKTKCVPFISFTQSPTDVHTFIITAMNQKARLYDLNRNTPALCQTYDMNRTEQRISWNTVKPWQEKTFIYANERDVFLMDIRSTPDQWLKTSCTRPANDFLCDVISAVVPSEMPNLVYVATNHKLHCLDLRKLGKDFESGGAICRWTHQMEYAPAFVDILSYGNVEFVAMASALAGDMRICELTREHKIKAAGTSRKLCKYKSHVLPFQPSSLKDAYQKARLSGKCLHPDAALKNRIRCCTTGLAFYESERIASGDNADKEILTLLLSSNSNGDVFAQSITRDSQECERRPSSQRDTDIMCKYEEKLCTLTQPDLNHTDVVDLKAIRKVFLCHALSASRTDTQDEKLYEEGVNNKVELTMPKRRSLGRWQKSIQTLHSYKDALVKNLLSVWDIEYDDKKDIKLGQINATVGDKPDPEKLVSSWLDANITHPQDNETLNTSIKLSTSMIMASEACDPDDTVKLDDFSLDLGTQQQSTQLMETLADISLTKGEEFALSQPQSKVVKKKKYIKGF